MSLSEFALIDRTFRKAGAMRADVHLGVGDDAAYCTSPHPGGTVVASIDTLVEGVHFPPLAASFIDIGVLAVTW